MCIPKFSASDENSLSPLYNEEGELIYDNSYTQVEIPQAVHNHVDSVYLNFDIELEDSILGFVYESGYEIKVVYTSDEAQDLCEIYEEQIIGDDPFEKEPFDSEPFDSNSIEQNPFVTDPSSEISVTTEQDYNTDHSIT